VNGRRFREPRRFHINYDVPSRAGEAAVSRGAAKSHRLRRRIGHAGGPFDSTMNPAPACLLLLFAAASLSGAETRTEVIRATTPALDAKPLSPDVPDVYAVDGKFERVVILRFKHQTELLDGLERMVK
jgi:hypothetical protein